MKNKKSMSRILTALALGTILTFGLGAVSYAAEAKTDPLVQPSNIVEQKLTLTQEWDKTFPKDARVKHSKVVFHNRYGITLAADLYIPKNAKAGGEAVGHCDGRALRRREGTGLRSLRTGNGSPGVHHHGL